jgi:hypothetical protein
MMQWENMEKLKIDKFSLFDVKSVDKEPFICDIYISWAL